jgi:hypothetical protein
MCYTMLKKFEVGLNCGLRENQSQIQNEKDARMIHVDTYWVFMMFNETPMEDYQMLF